MKDGISELPRGLRNNPGFQLVGAYIHEEVNAEVKIQAIKLDTNHSSIWTSLLQAWNFYKDKYISPRDTSTSSK